jgi:hypothetical protein
MPQRQQHIIDDINVEMMENPVSSQTATKLKSPGLSVESLLSKLGGSLEKGLN